VSPELLSFPKQKAKTTMRSPIQNLLNFLVKTILLATACVSQTIFDDATLRTAVAFWCAGAIGPDFTNSTFTLHGDITTWDVSAVISMLGLFKGQATCNPDLSGWNTAMVASMQEMFSGATLFNQAVPFDTSKVLYMNRMFFGASSFNQAVPFDTSSVIQMSGMFLQATSFNQAVPFDTSKVETMTAMFYGASSFDQAVLFNTSRVEAMYRMFGATSFDQVGPSHLSSGVMDSHVGWLNSSCVNLCA